MTANSMGGCRSEGRMTWSQALAGPLSEVECLWQDLDGAHCAPPPVQAPCTSVLWAWNADGRVLFRARLDGETVFLACHTVESDGTAPVVVQPWDPRDGRVRTHRTAVGSRPVIEQQWEQVVDHGLEHGTGPVTFLRPRLSSGRRNGDDPQPTGGGGHPRSVR
jgi:hypothetical protein